MAHNVVHVDAPAEEVFAALTDPDTYPQWLVGAKRIRGIEPEWPAEGSCFHHTVGGGPVRINDVTKVLEVDPPRRLVLEVRALPAGRGTSTFTIEPDGARCTVTLDEDPAETPLKVLTEPVLQGLVHLRNSASLRTLKRFVEDRAIPRTSGG